jgi:hypothetical protein
VGERKRLVTPPRSVTVELVVGLHFTEGRTHQLSRDETKRYRVPPPRPPAVQDEDS